MHFFRPLIFSLLILFLAGCVSAPFSTTSSEPAIVPPTMEQPENAVESVAPSLLHTEVSPVELPTDTLPNDLTPDVETVDNELLDAETVDTYL